jgi:hypothetical protein
MSDVATPTVPPQDPAAKPTMKEKLTKWASAFGGIMIAILGVIKLMESFTLPSCDSSRSLDAVHAIFKDKNLPQPTLTGVKSAGEGDKEKLCQAAYEIPNEKGTLDYKVFWEGWTAKVMITKVN